jgi:uncharacterized protein YqhQ
MSKSCSPQPEIPRNTGQSDVDADFAMGGQAVLEGVMMRGPRAYAIAVRRPQGDIRIVQRAMIPLVRRKRWLRFPIVRGAVSLVEMMLLGFRALDYSVNVAEQGLREQEAEKKKTAGEAATEPDTAPPKAEALKPLAVATATMSEPSASAVSADKSEPERAIGPWAMAATFALSMVLAVGLFIALPNVATHLLGMLPVFSSASASQLPEATELGTANADSRPVPTQAPSRSHLVEERRPVAYNLVAGFVRVLVLVGYIWGISFLKDIRRLFQYHGAEHKVVMAYEKKIPLEIERIRPVTKVHPRCGTTFIAIVLFVSIVVFAILAALVVRVYPPFAGWSIWARKPFLIGLHVLFLPLVAGLGYEITRRAGKHPDFWFYNLLLQPGYWFQRITTREPDDTMIEVALAAFNEVVEPRPLQK